MVSEVAPMKAAAQTKRINQNKPVWDNNKRVMEKKWKADKQKSTGRSLGNGNKNKIIVIVP